MCNLSPKQAGKMIGSFAGITALFSLIVIIIGTTTLQFQLDPAILQTCGNSGAFRTDCSVKDWEATSWRRLATKAMSDKPTERNLAGSESVHPATPNLWFDALFEPMFLQIFQALSCALLCKVCQYVSECSVTYTI